MSLEYIKGHYGVPAEVGRRVEYAGDKTGKPLTGVIVGARGQYLSIHLDGEDKPHHAPFHPTWEIKYLDEVVTPPVPKEVKLTRSQRRYQEYKESIYYDSGNSFAVFLGVEGRGRGRKKKKKPAPQP